MANFAKIYEYNCLITPDVKVIRISDDEQYNGRLIFNPFHRRPIIYS